MTAPRLPTLDAYPTGDEPTDNLRRMFYDGLRVAAARARLDARLGGGETLTVVALDLDRSVLVRQRGVGAKRHLVAQLHDLVRSGIPSDAEFLDSGSRDEGWVVLTGVDLQRAAGVAEELRQLVAGREFRLPDGEVVQLTTSLGVVASPVHGSCGADLLWAAGEALWHAKRARNCVHVAEGPIGLETVVVPMPCSDWEELSRLAQEGQRDRTSLVREAIQGLVEKHSARWYWVVERGGGIA